MREIIDLSNNDLYCWYITEDGSYVKIVGFEETTFDINARSLRISAIGMLYDPNGAVVPSIFYNYRGKVDNGLLQDAYDLVRKLDPIEVNLLRLDHVRR